ncbi:MAG: hypothetical protein ACE5DK_05285, partial [Paracoccaceae bacterium]
MPGIHEQAVSRAQNHRALAVCTGIGNRAADADRFWRGVAGIICAFIAMSGLQRMVAGASFGLWTDPIRNLVGWFGFAQANELPGFLLPDSEWLHAPESTPRRQRGRQYSVYLNPEGCVRGCFVGRARSALPADLRTAWVFLIEAVNMACIEARAR